MRLTRFGDYGLRILMQLAMHPDEWVSVREIADTHGASHDHLKKVGQQLAATGFVETRRGRGGGLRLARHPAEITVAEVLEAIEPRGVLDCFEDETACVWTNGCGLRGALMGAERAFYESLRDTTLADCLGSGDTLIALGRRPDGQA